MQQEITFTLNGNPVTCFVAPNMRLVDFIRDELKLTGTKEGCSVGECGACTVIVNKSAVCSCLLFAAQLNGAELVTVEGLETAGGLSMLQQKFLEHGAVQCGFCTPGMLMSAYALLLSNPHPTTEQIKTALAGNLCRCTGYKQIIEAIEDTSKS